MAGLREYRWLEYAKGTAEGTIFEGEAWVEDFFNAEDHAAAKQILKKRFSKRVKLVDKSTIRDNGKVTWQERFGLASLASFYLSFVTEIVVTKELMYKCHPDNLHSYDNPIGKKWHCDTKITQNGHLAIIADLAPLHPDSDAEYLVSVFTRDGEMLTPFRCFTSPYQSALDFANSI